MRSDALSGTREIRCTQQQHSRGHMNKRRVGLRTSVGETSAVSAGRQEREHETEHEAILGARSRLQGHEDCGSWRPRCVASIPSRLRKAHRKSSKGSLDTVGDSFPGCRSDSGESAWRSATPCSAPRTKRKTQTKAEDLRACTGIGRRCYGTLVRWLSKGQHSSGDRDHCGVRIR